MHLVSGKLSIIAMCLVLASAQIQLGFVPAPAPGPEALSLASASEPANQILTGPIDPVSTPVLAALVPIAGSVRTDVDTGVSQVESGIDDIKADLPGIEASFTGRKLLSASIQETRGKHIRAATLDGKPQLKRLQAQLEQKAQAEIAQAAASASAAAAVASNDTVVEDEDARIERELAQMKEDRLKAIQALPRSVWS